jgi:hypothetical protein
MRVLSIVLLIFSLHILMPVPSVGDTNAQDTLKLTAADTALADTLATTANAHQFEERPSGAKFSILVIWLVGGAVLMGYLVTRNMHMDFFE